MMRAFELNAIQTEIFEYFQQVFPGAFREEGKAKIL